MKSTKKTNLINYLLKRISVQVQEAVQYVYVKRFIMALFGSKFHHPIYQDHAKCVISYYRRTNKSFLLVDIGANKGLFSRYFLQNAYKYLSKVIMVEPNAILNSYYYDLQRKFNRKLIDIHNIAVSNLNKDEVVFNIYANHGLSSLSSLDSRIYGSSHGSELNKTIVVPQRTLDFLCDSIKADSSVFLKIDVQGSELEVLKGAENFMLKCNVEFVLVELSFDKSYQQAWEAHDVIKYLYELGYIVINISKGFQSNGIVKESDFLFKKNK